MQTFKKVFLLSCLILTIGGASVILAQSKDSTVDLTTNLANPIQHINKIIFAIPDNNPSNTGGWKTQWQVPVSSQGKIITIDGSLLTNVQEGNTTTTNLKNSSILGGNKNNFLVPVTGSTIIGGSENKVQANQSIILGGIKNQIQNTTSYRSTILGGSENTIKGAESTIIWGTQGNISGNNSVIIGGTNNTLKGNNSLVGWRNVTTNGNGIFVRSDGTKGTFTVSQSNLFAVNATSGVAVGTDTPNALATLTVNGDLRIQPNVADTNICNATTKGTMKSVNTTGGQLCACFCDGRAWQASLETPSCIRACDTNKQGLNALDKICDTKIRSATENHRFEPAWDSSLLGNTGGCTTGISLPQTSYFYATGINGSGITTHYRTCVEPKKAEFVECNSSFSCQKDPKFTLNTGSLVCSYSTTDPSEGKKDDRGLRENVNKKLIGTLGHQCKNATETPAELNNPSNQNQNCTNSNPVDDDSSQKCQFYCQNGWHKETKNGVDICIENSCGAQVVTHTQNWADTTKQVPYSVPCLDHGESKNIPYTTSLPNGTTITYTKNFSCKEGTLLSGAVQYTIESCNTGYHPFPLANNYIGSYRCDANQYKIDYYRDYTNGNNSPLTTQTQTYDTSFSLAGNFNRVGYTLKGWSTTQQKLWNIAKQSVSNYSPIPSFTAKEGSRTLNLSAPATWNFTANKTYPNYSTSNPEIFPLYAVWQRNSYTVTFQAGSGTLYGAGGSCAGDNSIRGWSIDQSTWLNTLSGMQAAAKPNILAVSGTLADKYPTAPTSCGTPSSVNSSCVSQGNVSLPWILLQQFSFTGTIAWSGGGSSILPEQVISSVILSGIILSGNQVITTGHLEMQKVSFQNTGFAGTEYKGFIWKVLDDNVPVTGPLSFKSQQTSPSTCVNQTSASTCASAKCTRVPSASVAGDGKTAMGTVVYDEAYGINVSLPIPTRVGYEFIGRYSTFSSTDLPPTANPPSGRITETTLMTTASNHILYPRWKEKQKFPAFALNVAVNGGCKKVPGAPSGNGRQRIGWDYSDFASCVGFIYVYDYHRSVWLQDTTVQIREGDPCLYGIAGFRLWDDNYGWDIVGNALLSRIPIIWWLTIGSWDNFWNGLTLGIYKGAQKFYVSYVEGTMTSSGTCYAPNTSKIKTVEVGTNSKKTIGAPNY